MTERKRIRRPHAGARPAQPVEPALGHAAAPMRTAVPSAVPAAPSAAASAVAAQPATTGAGYSGAAPAVRRSPVAALRRADPDNAAAAQARAEWKGRDEAVVNEKKAKTSEMDERAEAILKRPGEKARVSTSESDVLAKQLYATAQKAQEQITADVEAVMKRGLGERKGKEFVFKQPKGLSEKIGEELAKLKAEKAKAAAAGKEAAPVTAAEVASNFDASDLVGDALRYTIVYPHPTFTDSVLSALSNLAAKYKCEKVGNTFNKKGATYRGINTNWRPKDGAGMNIKWELQFHTRKSYDVKTYTNHKPYEAERALKGNSEEVEAERNRLKEYMQKNSDFAIPKGVDRIQKKYVDDLGKEGASSAVAVDDETPPGVERIKEKNG